MSENQAAAQGERFEVRVTADSHFAWLRTRLSIERTLMSWVRTSTALIGFGFTIVQFFERLGDMENVKSALRPAMPRYLGLALILSGIVALAISVWQYRALQRYLWSGTFAQIAGVRKDPVGTPLQPVAIGLVAIGIAAFLAIVFRLI